jgi:glycosyltransferase involved in cell wall biosynthesis
MIKISSIIIAKNEERNIGLCIKSQLEAIDEIIVLVDSSSTDGTLAIVKSFDKVICKEAEWRGYAETKNIALALTTNKWVFWIDADEAITEELKNELAEFKRQKPEFDAYSAPRKAYFLGRWIKHSGWYPGRVTRLFNKEKVGFSANDVHEHLVVNGAVGALKGDLDHFTDHNIEHYFLKFNKYTSLAADELYKKNKTAGLADLLIRPFVIFVKMYLLKLGFLDGFHGFILAVFSSVYVFTKYCKLWELNKNGKRAG